LYKGWGFRDSYLFYFVVLDYTKEGIRSGDYNWLGHKPPHTTRLIQTDISFGADLC
jgi:hypothetical protein